MTSWIQSSEYVFGESNLGTYKLVVTRTQGRMTPNQIELISPQGDVLWWASYVSGETTRFNHLVDEANELANQEIDIDWHRYGPVAPLGSDRVLWVVDE